MVQNRPGKAAAQDGATVEASQPVARKRGRPRAFETDAALAKALDAFRDTGFAATSLDDLSFAMGINRPSLYGAFGDKRELFLKAYERYRQEAGSLFAPAFDPSLSLREMLSRVFRTAIEVYVAGENGPRGCFTVMTAASEAMTDPEIRSLVQASVAGTDRALAERFRLAVEQGDLPKGANCDALARMTSAVIQSIAIRARARVPRRELALIAGDAIDLICPATAAKRRG